MKKEIQGSARKRRQISQNHDLDVNKNITYLTKMTLHQLYNIVF
jgi:hypothetical protein